MRPSAPEVQNKVLSFAFSFRFYKKHESFYLRFAWSSPVVLCVAPKPQVDGTKVTCVGSEPTHTPMLPRSHMKEGMLGAGLRAHFWKLTAW